jgi:hypothetical protein
LVGSGAAVSGDSASYAFGRFELRAIRVGSLSEIPVLTPNQRRGKARKHFVCLYQTLQGDPVYVGYGHAVERALTHTGGSHNAALKGWLARIRVSGQGKCRN